MYIILAFIAVVALALWAQRVNRIEQEQWANRLEQENVSQDELIRQSIVLIRRDVRLLVILLGGILVMLGAIAEKLK